MGMDSSSAQDHHQEMGSQTLESMLGCTITQQQEKKPRPSEQSLKCPRCDSTNTKFCYYNNYSLSQPRYFCKSCRRYWTKGGTLRNVPVGGGCRKNKRSSSSSSSSSTTSNSQLPKKLPHDQPLIAIPSLSYDSNDLSLAIARLQKQSNGAGHVGIMDGHDHFTILGQQNMAHVGNNSGYFLENSGGFQNVYYGMGINQDLGMGFDQDQFNGGGTSAISTAVTTVKQESFGSMREGGENGVLWSFPWKSFEGSGNSNNNIGEIDSGRVSSNWSNGIGLSSNWHGLLNSPLM